MFASTNILIFLNTASLVLQGLPLAVSPIQAMLPPMFSVYVFVASALVNLAMLAYKKTVETADASALAAASPYLTIVKV